MHGLLLTIKGHEGLSVHAVGSPSLHLASLQRLYSRRGNCQCFAAALFGLNAGRSYAHVTLTQQCQTTRPTLGVAASEGSRIDRPQLQTLKIEPPTSWPRCTAKRTTAGFPQDRWRRLPPLPAPNPALHRRRTGGSSCSAFPDHKQRGSSSGRRYPRSTRRWSPRATPSYCGGGGRMLRIRAVLGTGP